MAASTIVVIQIFITYLKDNVIYTFEEMINSLEGNYFGMVMFVFAYGVLGLKMFVCMIGHPFVIMREIYYPRPEAYDFAYAWIVFYFIEMLTVLPTLIIKMN